MSLIISSILIFIISLIMTMSGRGGGNFYVIVLVASGISMHHAAGTGQFILIATSLASSIIFQKRKTIDWKLALVLEPPTIIMAFFGGYYAYFFSGMALKLILSCLLVLASFLMLYPAKEKKGLNTEKLPGFWRRTYGEYTYTVNLWIAVPVTIMTGFAAGMVGISGGSFKVPLMVLACGVPMRIAVGTSSAMIGITALMGFLGHTVQDGFNGEIAIPLAAVAIAGGILGARFSFKVKSENLKKIFVYTTLGAAVFMFINAFLSK